MSVLGALLLGGCARPSDAADALPCVIALQGNGIHLRSDTSISASEYATRIVRDSKGNFYGSASGGAQVLKWAPDGTLLAAIGRPGDGPGELGLGGVSVFLADDSLYVRDNHRHWVIFDPELRFIRNAELGPIVAFARYDTHFIPGDLIVSTNQTAELPSDGIAIMSRDGRIIRSFAPLSERQERWQPHSRASSYIGGGQLWVAPVAGPKAGYRIEIWDTSGTLVDSIVRDVPWFKPDPEFTADYSADHQSRPFPYPSMSLVFADSLGFVWVISTLPKAADAEERIRSASLEEYFQVRQEVLQHHIDVFDAASKELVASEVMPISPALFSDPVFSGRLITQEKEDSLGGRVTVVTAFSLQNRSGGACAGT